jgi:hypothetical protein
MISLAVDVVDTCIMNCAESVFGPASLAPPDDR